MLLTLYYIGPCESAVAGIIFICQYYVLTVQFHRDQCLLEYHHCIIYVFPDIDRLRNLSWIRLYDTTRMNETSQRNSSAVKDRSAVEDLNR